MAISNLAAGRRLSPIRYLGGKQIFEFLSEMERGHENVLRQEIKALEKNPLWQDQQSGQFFHVHP